MPIIAPVDVLMAGVGAAPVIGPTGTRFKNRFERYTKALLETPYTGTPGEPVIPMDAKNFINKRAALQSTEKTATPLVTGARMAAPWFKNIGAKVLANPGKSFLLGGSLISVGALGGPTIEGLGRRIHKTMEPSIRDRANLDEEAATAYAKSVGKELGTKTVGLLSDIVSKAVQVPSTVLSSRARAGIFQTLQQEDDVIAQADPQQLAEAYHTMVRFAPTLATDKNAVKTFLRESVLYGTGPNFMSIKQLADAEHAVQAPQLGTSKH